MKPTGEKLKSAFARTLVPCLLALASVSQAAVLEGVRMHEAPDSTRVVFDTTVAVEYSVFTLD